MLDLGQDNQNEFHVYVKSIVLRFSIFEFPLISILKYIKNTKKFIYRESSISDLVESIFLKAKFGLIKLDLTQYFKMRNFNNNRDALYMTILYFIRILLFS